MLRLIVIVSLLLMGPVIASAQSLEGAWKSQEFEILSGPNAGTTGEVQPGLLILTGRHYGFGQVEGQEPRPQLSESSTAEERASVWGRYASNFGTYDVDGSTATFRPLVAIHPASMAPGNYFTWEIEELSADTLVYTARFRTTRFRATYTRVE